MKPPSLPQRENMIHLIHDKQRKVRLCDAADSKQLMLTARLTLTAFLYRAMFSAFGWFGCC